MSKILAIIDLDTERENGEVANKMAVNNEARAESARQHADQFSGKEQTAAFFDKMFDPALVAKDVIEDQARTWLEKIEERGAEIMYLTSRPHTMSAETRAWLAKNSISHPVIYKYYGTGEKRPDGQMDNGERFVKTPEWKKRETEHALDALKPDWLIFVDDEEANRAKVAEIGAPCILIRCSLEDAATHDFQHWESTAGTPFLSRLQKLANILEEREAFEAAEKWSVEISHPLIPGQQEQPGMIARLEAWNAAAYALGAEPRERFYRYSELMPQYKNGELELVCALEVNCDQTGRIASVKMARPGPDLRLLNQLENSFDMATEQEKAQGWADGYLAGAIAERGYVEAARAQRGLQIGKSAMDAYLEHVRMKNEEIKDALGGKRGKGE